MQLSAVYVLLHEGLSKVLVRAYLTIHRNNFIYFYRAMHLSTYARSWDRMSSVRLSVRLSVCDVGDL